MKQNNNSLSASEQFTISAPLQLQYFMRAYEFLFAAAVVSKLLEFVLTIRDSYYFNIDVTKIFER